MAKESTFRGYWSIKEALEKIIPLAAFLRANKPECRRITIKKIDYDLIARWPKAAGVLGFVVNNGRIFYGEFSIEPDKSKSRYSVNSEKQAEIS